MDNNNIVLIGFMGTGKTAVGKRLANLLNKPFYDTDQEVEKVTGMSLTKLFNKYGMIRFRSEEELMIKKLAEKTNSIIATGGSLVLTNESFERLQQSGVVICLTAQPEIIHDRVKRRNNRPLLNKEFLYEDILDKIKERDAMYKKANLVIDTSDMDFEEIINEIIGFLEKEKKSV